MRKKAIVCCATFGAIFSTLIFHGASANAENIDKYRIVDCTLQGAVHYVDLTSIPGEAKVQAFIKEIESSAYSVKLTSAGVSIARLWPGFHGTGVCVLYSTNGDAKTTPIQAKLLRAGYTWVQIHRYPAKSLKLYATGK